MYYGDKQDSLLNIMRALEVNNWKIYGYKPNMSDSMRDYFDPASWSGIAAKNGYILVVDNYQNGSMGGDFYRSSYDAKILKKIEKLKNLRDNKSASVGEVENANKILEELEQKAETKELITSSLEKIEYQSNPKNAKWHIEKDGIIIAKGNGVFTFSSLDLHRYRNESTYYYLDNEEMNYKAGFLQKERSSSSRSTPWCESYTFKDFKESTLKSREKSEKNLNKLFNLVAKWDKLTALKIGDGEEEKLTRVITKKKILSHYEAKEVKHETNYIKCCNKYSYVGNIVSGNVYKIEKDSKGNKISKKLTKKWVDGEKYSQVVKTEPRKNTKGHHYSEIYGADKIVNVELIPVYETIEVEKWVKVNPKPKAKTTKTNLKEEATKTEPTSQTELLNIIFSATAGTWTNKKGDRFNTLVLTQRVKKEDWKTFTQLLKDEGIGYYNFKAKAIVCDKIETPPATQEKTEKQTIIKGIESPTLPKNQEKTIASATNFKKEFNQTIKKVKEQGEDFEWYPTPKEVIVKIHQNSYNFNSFMDVGAGNGSFFEIFNSINEKQQIKEKYAIEKSTPLIQAMPNDIILVGTDFNEQTFIDKEVDSIYCNPPYSEHSQWSVKLIREANAKELFLLIPQRAEENKAIKEAVDFRDATIKEIYKYDFKNSEFRKARAKVRLYKISFKRYNGKKDSDPFTSWFNEEFNMNAKQHEFKYEWNHEKEEKLKQELTNGNDLVSRLVSLYNEEINQAITTMKEITSLSESALNELGSLMKKGTHTTGISMKNFIKNFEMKINGIKRLYWQEIFNNLEKITDKLTTKSRASMLDTLTKNTNIDFTESNIYGVLVWVIKNANFYFDEQLKEVYQDLTNQENMKKYKSNIHMTKDTWRYNEFNQELRDGIINKYSLDYRTVHSGYTALESSWNGEPKNNGNLSEKSKNFLNDLVTIAKNLNFNIEENPLKQGFYAGQKTIIDFKDREEIFLQIRPYKNGNIHLKFSQKFMRAFNIEAARLNGWIKSPQEAAEEMDISVNDAKAFFESSLQLEVGSTNLLIEE